IIPGRGIRAETKTGVILVGNTALLQEHSIQIPSEIEEGFEQCAAGGDTVMYVAYKEQVIGLIGVRDQVRPEAADAIAQLKSAGILRQRMLTGDGEAAATAVASSLGITDWRSRMLPDEKCDEIRALQETGHRVAMVGDGINDAPALATADVGIAMG